MLSKMKKVAELYAVQRPRPLVLAPGLCLYTDQCVEQMRYDVALPLLEAHALRYRARPYEHPVHAKPTDRCYDAAFALAEHDDLLYCEGFLLGPEESWRLAHGWCMTKQGRIVDPTLHAHQHRIGVYYGFALQREYVRRWKAEHGYFGLLDGSLKGEVGIHFEDPSKWLIEVDWRNDE